MSQSSSNFTVSQIVNPYSNFHIEPSGIAYHLKLKSYLVISDDTPDDKPVVFLMNNEGVITGIKEIVGVDKISDLEAIHISGSLLYLCSSLSYSAKGKLPLKRRQLLIVDMKKNQWVKKYSFDLYSAMENWALKNSTQSAARYLITGINDHTLDIEGIEVEGDFLYLGCKNPFHKGNAVILKVDINALITNKLSGSSDIRIWRELKLQGKTNSKSHISDMVIRNNKLYLASTCEGSCINGVVWEYLPGSNQLIKIAEFPGRKAEGLTFTPDGNIIVVFDNGSKGLPEFTVLTIK
jgi:hypothetical protein